MNGYVFHSYLTYSSAFQALSSNAQAAFKATLPVKRTGGVEPTTNSGSYSHSSQYARSGVGLSRDVYVAF